MSKATRKCVKCGKIMPLALFSPNKRSADGLSHTCDICKGVPVAQLATSFAKARKRVRKAIDTKNMRRGPLSDSVKMKISRALQGKIPWNKGIKTGIPPWNKGKCGGSVSETPK